MNFIYKVGILFFFSTAAYSKTPAQLALDMANKEFMILSMMKFILFKIVKLVRFYLT